MFSADNFIEVIKYLEQLEDKLDLVLSKLKKIEEILQVKNNEPR